MYDYSNILTLPTKAFKTESRLIPLRFIRSFRFCFAKPAKPKALYISYLLRSSE